MTKDRTELAVHVHLTEYSALRQEMLQMIMWRERLVFLSLGISGALLSFALSVDRPMQGSLMSRHMALYLIAPLAAAIGGLWLVNAHRIYRIGVYIRDILSPKINALLTDPATTGRTTMFDVFSWESSNQRVMRKWWRRVLEWIVLLSAFVFAGLGAQYMIIIDRQGPFIDRVRTVESPLWFSVNCAVVFASLLLFIQHLWFGRKNTGSSGIREP
jgi:hypothetical protein